MIAASTAARGDENAAQIPSPVCLKSDPPQSVTAVRRTSSCATNADRIAPGSASHRRVDPSMSVKRNVTTPDGAAAPAVRAFTANHIPPTTQHVRAGSRPERIA
jgi:hypothetical protein